MPSYKVAAGRSVMLPVRNKNASKTAPSSILKAGESVPSGVFTSEQLAEHVNGGFLVVDNSVYGNNTADNDKPLGGTIPGEVEVRKGQPIPIRTEDGKRGIRQKTGNPRGAITSGPAEDKTSTITTRTSKFDLDPASLDEKGLEELHVMLSERGVEASVIAEIATAQDAIDFLSQDFEPDTE